MPELTFSYEYYTTVSGWVTVIFLNLPDGNQTEIASDGLLNESQCFDKILKIYPEFDEVYNLVNVQ